ncbi:hypothetical protein NDU88_002132 [Pleurodeles waltl]|uniref:Uncharacterized protein n=1 Tax=Pleurodeles waltl TaxID=8319 RepID=A0AAV7Q821_PLEWA|nr:hypothetical protein NDU88_002132 [Pleurodeles waltl]
MRRLRRSAPECSEEIIRTAGKARFGGAVLRAEPDLPRGAGGRVARHERGWMTVGWRINHQEERRSRVCWAASPPSNRRPASLVPADATACSSRQFGFGFGTQHRAPNLNITQCYL